MINIDWQAFMATQGMACNEVDGCTSTKTSTPVTEDQPTLCDLSNFGLIRAQGKDARQFLQNQFSNDVNAVSPQLSQLNAYCTPKGRVLALFRLLQIGEDFYLHLPQSRIPAMLQRLRMFVLMSDVKLEDVSDQWVGLGVTGSTAVEHLQSVVGPLPTSTDECVVNGKSAIASLPGGQRYLLLAATEQAIQYWHGLKTQYQISNSAWWSLQDIRAGLPQVLEANVEAFVPQMLNLDLVNGLSFRKGCYPGQEIVARTRYLGKTKRRMFRAVIDMQSPPAPGADVVAQTDGSKVGSVVLSATAPGQGSELLAVLQIAAAKSQALQVDDATLILKDLPYSVEEKEE